MVHLQADGYTYHEIAEICNITSHGVHRPVLSPPQKSTESGWNGGVTPFMTNEKITAMPVKKTQIHLTATLSLPLRLHERAWILTGSRSLSTSLVQQILEVSQDGVVFEN